MSDTNISNNNCSNNLLSVSVTYANPDNPIWLHVKVNAGSTVEDAIKASDLIHRYPDIDIEKMKVGIFGKATTLGQTLTNGDRVELYQSITVDPKTVPRRKKNKKQIIQ